MNEHDGGFECTECGVLRDAGELETFAVDPNLDAVRACAACAKRLRDDFCGAVAAELGRSLTGDEREMVWGIAHTEYDSAAVAERIARVSL